MEENSVVRVEVGEVENLTHLDTHLIISGQAPNEEISLSQYLSNISASLPGNISISKTKVVVVKVTQLIA